MTTASYVKVLGFLQGLKHSSLGKRGCPAIPPRGHVTVKPAFAVLELIMLPMTVLLTSFIQAACGS
jgi:hypothetical protein